METWMMRLFSAVTAILCSLSASAAEDYPKAQLPDSVTPTKYALELTVLPEKESFSGRTVIDVILSEQTSQIWLHALDFTSSSASVTDSAGRKHAATLTEVAGSGGVAKLTTSDVLPAGPAKIDIAYTAPFNRRLEGLYRTDEDGESYAFSQMEPIFARGAFPSFDEPRFKTPYETTLIVHDNHVTISNTPTVREEKLDGGLKRITFAPSKPLPTYLIAFAVGPLDVVEWKPIRKTALRDREIPLRGIAAKGKGKLFSYALENTEPMLVILEEYFGSPYPYEKLDLIAAIDFSAGAMENAGAIVYREVLMLFDEKASLNQKRRYVLTHAHEMAHQWFGNLVTPAWWNDIWLNEAFATWMEYKTARKFDPNGEYGRLNLAGSLGAMRSDSWRSARRIANPVDNNDDISNAFDGITYEKGGGVLAMFERYYGEEAFRRGVQLHMRRFEHGVATSRDFMQSIADANGDSSGVAAFESFLNQAGVPTVRADLKCGKSGADVTLSQSRYSARVEAPTTDQRWQIPLCIVAGGKGAERSTACAVMYERRTTVKLPGPSCPAWVIPNADGAGYLRFSLDRKEWAALFAHVNELNPSERLAALDSLDAAFTSGAVEIDTYAEGIQALLNTPGGMPEWDVASAPISRLGWIANTLVRDQHRDGVVDYL
ncbi:MAG: M1 family metallopeptidase, partial [Alphaproteobacteria bacterium]|nr:M1 family metallopeptidase [Alphaproteobacteria bacterium]